MEYTNCKEAQVSNDGSKIKLQLKFSNGSSVQLEMDEDNGLKLVTEIVRHMNEVNGSSVKYEIGRRQTIGISGIEGTQAQDSGAEGNQSRQAE